MPPAEYRVPCLHPVPPAQDAYSNRDMYNWLSRYQEALKNCNAAKEYIYQYYDDWEPGE